jgi:hypothetical protein
MVRGDCCDIHIGDTIGWTGSGTEESSERAIGVRP